MQVDSHLPELTVRETLDFASRVQGPGRKRGAFRYMHCSKPEGHWDNPARVFDLTATPTYVWWSAKQDARPTALYLYHCIKKDSCLGS